LPRFQRWAGWQVLKEIGDGLETYDLAPKAVNHFNGEVALVETKVQNN
jgi:hypothetical protein